MPSLGSAIFTIEAHDTTFSKVLTTAGEKAGALGTKMRTAGSQISVGLLPVTNAIQGLGKDAIDAASSMAESLSKVNVVFGVNAAEITAWSQTSATAFGISQQKALEAAGTFGNLFSALGVVPDAGKKMSMSLIELAADLASFNNIDPTIALEKLRAGLVGEAEPLRALGVNLTAATVEAKAFEMGIARTGEELTDNEKVQARYALILDQTKLAQGDFARTSDGLANQLRIQKAEQENVSAQLGVALVPVMQMMIGATKTLTGFFTGLSPEMQKAVIVGGGLLLVLGPMLTIFGVIVSVLGFAATAFGVLSTFVAGSTLVVGGMTIALGPLLLIVGAIALAVGLLYLAWTNNWGGIQEKTAAVMGFLTDVFASFRDFFIGLWQSLPGPVRAAIGAITAPISGLIGLVQGALGWLQQLGAAQASTNMNGVHSDAGAAGLGGWGASAIPAASGFAGTVTRPTLFLAGEAGREHVSVVPEGRGGGGDGDGHGHPIVMDGRLVGQLIGGRYVRGAAFAGRAIG